MKKSFSKYIIIGAGLSGLTAAYRLFKAGEEDFVVLESRDRIGGRILTVDGLDLGATWFQAPHKTIMELLEELEIEKFQQFNTGKSVLVYSGRPAEHFFADEENTPTAYRIQGNSGALIRALARPFSGHIKTDASVTEIGTHENGLTVTTDKGDFTCEKAIVALPPRVASQISFAPGLPDALTGAMAETHTWMSNAIKVGISYETPFWRNKNLSGMVVGQAGAVTEIYDHSDMANEHYALMGFIKESLRDISAAERKQKVLDYLCKHLGDEILDYQVYEEKDWSRDKNTAGKTVESIYMSPSYGNSVFDNVYLNERLVFAGAETSPVHGGYMDGAILSGIRAVERLLPC